MTSTSFPAFIGSPFSSRSEYEAARLLPLEERAAALSAAQAKVAAAEAAPNAGPIPAPAGTPRPKQPTACIVIGMAGSGKTTLMQRLNAHLHEAQLPYYMINLDPAVLETPFGANIDIRDTVNYKEVMKQYGLGPNGGILTALNLFATRFEQAALPSR